MRKLISILLLVLMVIGAAAYFIVGAWAQSQLADYLTTWKQAVAAEQEQSDTLPAVFPEPIDDNAAPRYQHLLAVAEKWDIADDVLSHIRDAARTGPAVPVTPQLALQLQKYQGELEELRDTFRYTHCDWKIDYAQGYNGTLPPLKSTRLLANLLLLEGHQLAGSDWNEAARRYLGVVRFGMDLSRGPFLLMGVTGTVIAEDGLDALKRLILRQSPPGGLQPGLAAALQQMEQALASPSKMFKKEQLLMAGSIMSLGGEQSAYFISGLTSALGDDSKGIFTLAPVSLFKLRTLQELDVYYQSMAEVKDQASQAGMQAVFAINERAMSSWNPLVKIVLPNYFTALEKIDNLAANYRLVLSALAIEQQRAAAGQYPAAANSLAVDPYAAPAKLHYQVTGNGSGYRLWSVGENGKDDAGKGDDILLERKG